ncbi:MAG: heavy-metal-associated domain-containing protein [bacterium]
MQKTIEVHGMSCGHCEGRVKKELEKITGVESAEASAVDKEVVVTLSEEIDNARLKEAVEEAGYEFIKVK